MPDVLLNGEVRVVEGAELAGSLPGEAFEDPAQMALIGEAGVTGNDRKIGPAACQSAAHKLYSETVHEVRHGAPVALAENAGKMDRVDADLGGNFFEGKRFAEGCMEQFGCTTESRL